MNIVQSWRLAVVGVVVLGVALAGGACASDDDGDATATIEATATANAPVEPLTLADVSERGPYEVGVATLDLVDTSRGTDASGDAPASDERVLTTEVWYPARVGQGSDGRDAAVDESAGPYPLIVFAHGLSSSRLFSPDYTQHLASHGYVVAAPDFPLTRIGTPGGVRFTDTVNQAGDVSFVIDSMLALNESAGHRFEGAIDAETIGLSGHSGGGFTTLITVYGIYGAERDERIDAALPISASGCFYDEDDVGDVDIPMMFLTGSEDLIVPRGGNRRAYDVANAPRYWVEIAGANHVRFSFADIDDAVVAGRVLDLAGADDAEGSSSDDEDVDEATDGCAGGADPLGATPLTLSEQNEALRIFATPFFDAYLREDAAALAFLRDGLGAAVGDRASYEFDAGD